jgi:hypothetical protein
MLFHYGNCKSKITDLEFRCANLHTQNKALYIQLQHLEQELLGKNCAFETMAAENHNLNQIISRKDEEIKDLKREYAAREQNAPIVIADRKPHTGEVTHTDYTDGERSTFIDLTKPNKEIVIKMDRPLKDEGYYKLKKEIEEKYTVEQEPEEPQPVEFTQELRDEMNKAAKKAGWIVEETHSYPKTKSKRKNKSSRRQNGDN